MYVIRCGNLYLVVSDSGYRWTADCSIASLFTLNGLDHLPTFLLTYDIVKVEV